MAVTRCLHPVLRVKQSLRGAEGKTVKRNINFMDLTGGALRSDGGVEPAACRGRGRTRASVLRAFMAALRRPHYYGNECVAAAAEWSAHTLNTTRVKQSSSSTGWRGSAPLQLLHGLLAKNMTAGWKPALGRHQKAFRLPAAECRQSVGTPTPLRLHTYIQQNPRLPVGLPQSGDVFGDSLRIIPTASQSGPQTQTFVSSCCTFQHLLPADV